MASLTTGKTRPVRLADIAKAAGVSHGTASNVFARPEIVREEVRERVKAAAEAMGYAGPDPKGRLLRAGKVNAIGVATDEPLSYFFDDPFARVMMASISQACDATGAGISLVSAANNEQLAWNIQSALVDGFIVFCIEGSSRLVELARERKLPFVALDLDSRMSRSRRSASTTLPAPALPRAIWPSLAIVALPCWPWNLPTPALVRSRKSRSRRRPSIPARATVCVATWANSPASASTSRKCLSTRP